MILTLEQNETHWSTTESFARAAKSLRNFLGRMLWSLSRHEEGVAVILLSSDPENEQGIMLHRSLHSDILYPPGKIDLKSRRKY
jgi:hypothetical protein